MDEKKLERMNIICNALDEGWTVRKMANNSNPNTYEFTKFNSINTVNTLNIEHNNIVIFSRNDILNDIDKYIKHERSVVKKIRSAP